VPIRNRNRGRSRAFRLELLESRELLSTVGNFERNIAEVSLAIPALHQTIAGSYSGSAIASPTSELGGTSTFKTTGTAIGASTFDGSDSYSANKHRDVKYTHGVATLADMSGDEINVTFAGKGHETVSGEFTVSVKGKVTGGAGTYAGTAGTFSESGTFDYSTGAFSTNIKIVLKKL